MYKRSSTGLIITLDIVFADIGTSPLFVIKAIVGESIVSQEIILGGLCCVFWALTTLVDISGMLIYFGLVSLLMT